MASIVETAAAFFELCEAGKGWEVCRRFCTPDASFSAQAEPLAEIRTLEGYTNWMAWLFGPLPDGRYELKSLAVDLEHASVCAFAVFSGTHTGERGPVPPTGRRVEADYVYIMSFEGQRIRHVTKVWNAGWSLRQLGWA